MKNPQIINTKKQQPQQERQTNELNPTLKGVLLNNFVRNSQNSNLSFDEIQDSLLICEDAKCKPASPLKKDEKTSFDIKKAIKPLLIGTGAVLAGCFGISAVLKNLLKDFFRHKVFSSFPTLQ